MFDYKEIITAQSVAHAAQLLDDNPSARLIAGGTDILVGLRHAMQHDPKHRPPTLIDIHDLPECQGIRLSKEGTLHIGSGATFSDLIRHPLVATHAPILCEMSNTVAGPQIRNVATLGGNICNGAVSADSIPPLLVLDASIRLVSTTDITIRPLLGFHTGPGKVDLAKTNLGKENLGKENLGASAILTHILLDTQALQHTGTATYKYATRAAMDIATIICSAAVQLDGDTITQCRLAYGVAAPTPIRCAAAEQYALGKQANTKTFAEIARIATAEDVSPRSSWRAEKSFRLHIIETLACRMLEQASQSARGSYATI